MPQPDVDPGHGVATRSDVTVEDRHAERLEALFRVTHEAEQGGDLGDIDAADGRVGAGNVRRDRLDGQLAHGRGS